MLNKIRRFPDTLAVLILVALWLIFFWRIWTPNEIDRVSFTEGDFASQFTTWAHYAASRLHEGEIPLWNPYQYGGAPFQADPQVRLTYPPHWITLGFLAAQEQLEPWEAYRALQWEAILHVLFASLFLYSFMRRLISENPQMSRYGSILGALIAAIAYGYGGYLSGYPPLQLPLLETGIWLPLVLLGILNATYTHKQAFDWNWLMFSAAMLGISFLAGHPQTGFFTAYLAVAFLTYRIWERRWGWRVWLLSVMVLAVLSAALAAVQLLPAAEFTQYTYRGDLSFEDKGGGYTFEELANLVLPPRREIWIPLYFGLVTLALMAAALLQRVRLSRFFIGVVIFSFIIAFGQRTILYSFFYLLVPGSTLFRGQERITFLIAYSIAILAGLGAASLTAGIDPLHEQRLRKWIGIAALVMSLFTVGMFILAQTAQRNESIVNRLENGAFSALILIVMWAGMAWLTSPPSPQVEKGQGGEVWRGAALIGLLVFDLFSSTAMVRQNYEPVPVSSRLQEPAFVSVMKTRLEPGDRVETLTGLPLGYSVAFQLPEIYGTNPLQNESIQFYTEQLPAERRWELLAVRFLNSAWEELPIPATRIAEFEQPFPLTTYELNDPRPFAHPIYSAWIVSSVEEARGIVAEPSFDLRHQVVLEQIPGELPGIPESEEPHQVTITQFEPEVISMDVVVPYPAVLTLALPYTPGWKATVDGETVDIFRAYGGLSAVYITENEHFVKFSYEPASLMLGAGISMLSWIIVLVRGTVLAIYKLRQNADQH